MYRRHLEESMPTITPTPDHPGSWHHVANLKPGRARVASHIDTDVHPSVRHDTPYKHVIVVDFSPEVVDDTGRSVERDADPDAGEIQAPNGRGVIADPIFVNNRPYGGMVWVERGWNPATGRYIEAGETGWRPGFDHYRATQASLKRLDGGEVTDAARTKLREAAIQIASFVGTPEQLYADRLADARHDLERASRELEEAQQAYSAAIERVAGIEREA